jgi:molybdenum cofactor biosynthesis protein B
VSATSSGTSGETKPAIRVATITASDTRTAADDEGGRLLRELLSSAGFATLEHAIVREDLETLRAAVIAAAAHDDVDAVIVTGGTGLGPRDITIEAIAPILDKVMDGFGEAFRRLSWDEIGARAMLSRAIAGTRGTRIVVALPGSPNGVRLGVTALVAPVLAHAVAVARGEAKHHHKKPKE